MRVKEYERSNTIHNDDVFIIDGSNGTKTIVPEQLVPYTFEAEAWAEGTMDGVPVPGWHRAHNHDAKTHANEAEAFANTALSASNNASSSEANARNYEQIALNAATNANEDASKAETAASNAIDSEMNASSSAANSRTSEMHAFQSENSAYNSALKAEGYAIGEQNGVPVPSTSPYYENSAKYWAEYSRIYAEGGIHYKTSIYFADIPTSGMALGDMYDIKDDFTSDSRFSDGGGIDYDAGTNIIWNINNKWDIDPQGSCGGGHTIVNSSGTEMTQRSKLKFMGCDVTDDAENNTTVVAGFDKTANQTLSGNVTFTKRPLVDISDTALTAQEGANILSFKYKNSVSKVKTVNVIRTYGDAENSEYNGTAIIGSSSGQTVISSGEGAPKVMKTLSEFDNTNEKLYAMSDSGIDIYTNCNTADNAVKAIAIAANGEITLATNAITSLKNALGIGTTDISAVGQTVTGAIKGRLTANYNGTEIPFQFAIDSSGNYGYKKAGADTVYPFKKGIAVSCTYFYHQENTASSSAGTWNATVNGFEPGKLYVCLCAGRGRGYDYSERAYYDSPATRGNWTTLYYNAQYDNWNDSSGSVDRKIRLGLFIGVKGPGTSSGFGVNGTTRALYIFKVEIS